MVLTVHAPWILTQGRARPEFDVVRLGCQRVGDRLRPRRSAGKCQVGTKATARRLVSALVKEMAHGHWVGARNVGVPDRFTSRAGTEK